MVRGVVLILVGVVFRKFDSILIDPSDFVGNELFEGFVVGDFNTRNGPAIGHSLENAFQGARFVSVVDGVISSVIHYGTIIPKTRRK